VPPKCGLPALSLDAGQRRRHIGDRNIKRHMRTILTHGADAACDSRARIDHRLAVHYRRDLPFEDGFVEGVEHLHVLAHHFEMHNRISPFETPPWLTCKPIYTPLFPRKSNKNQANSPCQKYFLKPSCIPFQIAIYLLHIAMDGQAKAIPLQPTPGEASS
jgi:hypothetical protein